MSESGFGIEPGARSPSSPPSRAEGSSEKRFASVPKSSPDAAIRAIIAIFRFAVSSSTASSFSRFGTSFSFRGVTEIWRTTLLGGRANSSLWESYQARTSVSGKTPFSIRSMAASARIELRASSSFVAISGSSVSFESSASSTRSWRWAKSRMSDSLPRRSYSVRAAGASPFRTSSYRSRRSA